MDGGGRPERGDAPHRRVVPRARLAVMRRRITPTDRLLIGYVVINGAVVWWHASEVSAWPWLLLANALTLVLIALFAGADRARVRRHARLLRLLPGVRPVPGHGPASLLRRRHRANRRSLPGAAHEGGAAWRNRDGDGVPFLARGGLLVRGVRTMAGPAPTGAVADRKSTRLNSSHIQKSRMPSSA